MQRGPRYLFVSDLHLDAAAPDASTQFLAFLREEAVRCTALYVLGDLFEAWIGDDDTDPHRREVCAGLGRLTAAGVPCYVVRGNRDFLFGTRFERETGCELLPDPVLATLEGVRVFVSHGDILCTDDHAYQELRTLVRDARWQARFLALPLSARRSLAEQARAGSRAHTEKSMAQQRHERGMRDIMDVNEAAVAAAFRLSGTRLMIHGHTHRPGIYRHEVDGEPAVRIVLGDWYEQGSYLVWEQARYELRSLTR